VWRCQVQVWAVGLAGEIDEQQHGTGDRRQQAQS
jgi:hypothetical protein